MLRVLLQFQSVHVEKFYKTCQGKPMLCAGSLRSAIPDTYSLLGFSKGRWEGETLIVETERVEAAILYGDGTPQGREIQLVERFTMNEAQDQLNYRVSITDPENFSETLEFTRYWVWQPDIRLQAYNCGNQL